MSLLESDMNFSEIITSRIEQSVSNSHRLGRNKQTPGHRPWESGFHRLGRSVSATDR